MPKITEVTTKQLTEILESAFFPEGIEANNCYFRTHDDCDGDRSEGINVVIGPDSDAWIAIHQRNNSCRYRTYYGGGLSKRTRNALLILALAIKLDNDEADISKW